MEEQPMHEIRTAEPAGYAEFVAELKQRIERVQLPASLAVNQELYAEQRGKSYAK
jgi:hypothetical protein